MARILIVDDTPVVRQGMALVATSMGYDVDEAWNGREALAKMEKEKYAVVLMDYNMPVMNGLECAAQIREIEKDTGNRTPIICMTANPENREDCVNAGMDGFVDKECSNEELQEVLLKWLDLSDHAAGMPRD